MPKDPAFLFYSNDFYEGTRLMLPEERACYIDLLIYQHQHGFIPNDLRRVMMYCSGIDEATLKATLEAKFKQTDKGWYNVKLKEIIEQRQEYTNKQSENGLVGQFFKKAKNQVKPAVLKQLRDYIYSEYGKENLIKELKKEQTTHEGLLKALLKHLEDEDEDENKESNKISFDKIWNLYDKKVGDKSKLEKKWNSLSLKDQEEIIKYVPRYKQAQPNKKYRKNFQTFLNNRGWEDELIFNQEKKQDDPQPFRSLISLKKV